MPDDGKNKVPGIKKSYLKEFKISFLSGGVHGIFVVMHCKFITIFKKER